MDHSSVKIWRVVDLLKWSKDYLAEKGIESPQIETEWLLRHVLNCSRIDIYLNHERPLSADELAAYKKLLLKRVNGVPIQYVLGYTEFMGHPFKVSPAVLIPRPETELLVENVLSLITKDKLSSPQILDVGTGSGCIAVSIALASKENRITALDISPNALKVARENTEILQVVDQIDFVQLDILNQLPRKNGFNIIVSNPPYVAGKYWEDLPDLVRKNEPEIALYPGKDGLVFYRRLAELSLTHLLNDGYLVVEIGGTYQAEDVSRIFSESGLTISEIINDYSGQKRIVVASKHE